MKNMRPKFRIFFIYKYYNLSKLLGKDTQKMRFLCMFAIETNHKT